MTDRSTRFSFFSHCRPPRSAWVFETYSHMRRSLASGGATSSSWSVPVGQVPRQTRHSSSDERVTGEPGIRSGCAQLRQHAPSADNAAHAAAEQAFDSLRSRRSSSSQYFGGAPSAVDRSHMNKRTATVQRCGCTNGWRGGHQPRLNSSGALMRDRMHAYECHASALPNCMRPKKLSARLPHVHVRDV